MAQEGGAEYLKVVELGKGGKADFMPFLQVPTADASRGIPCAAIKS